jgi:hypothetical protein
MSLLTTFINDKIREYQEPTRKGTPKGEPIGFSKRKFAAALLKISDSPMINFYHQIKVDYQVLRKWNTEEEFQKLANQMALECADYIAAWVKDKFNKCKTPDEWLELLFMPLNDIDQYGETLMSHLKEKLYPIKPGKETKVTMEVFEKTLMAYRKEKLYPIKPGKLKKEEIEDMINMLRGFDYDYIIDFDIMNLFSAMFNWVFSLGRGNLGNFAPMLSEVVSVLKAKKFTENMDDGISDDLRIFIIDDFIHHDMAINRLRSEPARPTRIREIHINLATQLF